MRFNDHLRRSGWFAALASFAALGVTLTHAAEQGAPATEGGHVFNARETRLDRSTGRVLVVGAPVTGVVIERDRLGRMMERANYREGVRDGLREKFFDDGRLSFSATYVDGKRDGTSTTWWRNGAKRSESHHEAGIAQGTQRQWYASGALFKEMQLKDGRESGLQRSWRKNGKLYNNYEAHGDRVYGLKRSKLCFRVDASDVIDEAEEVLQ